MISSVANTPSVMVTAWGTAHFGLYRIGQSCVNDRGELHRRLGTLACLDFEPLPFASFDPRAERVRDQLQQRPLDTRRSGIARVLLVTYADKVAELALWIDDSVLDDSGFVALATSLLSSNDARPASCGHHIIVSSYRRRDSNPQHPDLESSASTRLSYDGVPTTGLEPALDAV